MFGWEHVIANQYLLPIAIAMGSPITAYDIVVRNFIPATIGNWVSCVCMCARTRACAHVCVCACAVLTIHLLQPMLLADWRRRLRGVRLRVCVWHPQQGGQRLGGQGDRLVGQALVRAARGGSQRTGAAPRGAAHCVTCLLVVHRNQVFGHIVGQSLNGGVLSRPLGITLVRRACSLPADLPGAGGAAGGAAGSGVPTLRPLTAL